MHSKRRIDILQYLLVQAEEKARHSSKKTAANYYSVYKSFSRYLEEKEHVKRLYVYNLSGALVERYENYLLKERGITRNSSSFYMRILKCVYNKIVSEYDCELVNPFKKVYCGVDKTVKRAVNIQTITKLMNYEPLNKGEAFSQDAFIFCFLARGMAFIDLAKLKKNNIINNRLVYRRSKTGQLISIKLESSIIAIINKYANDNSPFLFPIIKSQQFNQDEYDKALLLHNYHLRCISSNLGLNTPLSSYVARHTWATEAMKSHVPIRVISESMGHANERMTNIYLASIENSEIDAANMKVIKKLISTACQHQ